MPGRGSRRSPRLQETLWRELGRQGTEPAKPIDDEVTRLERILAKDDPFMSPRTRRQLERDLQSARMRRAARNRVATTTRKAPRRRSTHNRSTSLVRWKTKEYEAASGDLLTVYAGKGARASYVVTTHGLTRATLRVSRPTGSVAYEVRSFFPVRRARAMAEEHEVGGREVARAWVLA